MDFENMETLKQTTELITGHKLPRWRELPDLDIYMDQVISLLSRYFEGYPGCDEKGITSSMVNNYVKQGIIPPPQSKKYNRIHLAYLIIICIMKNIMPISMVGKAIRGKTETETDYEELYNRFCDYFESSAQAVAESVRKLSDNDISFTDIVFSSALRAHAEQTVVLGLLKDA